MATVSRLPARIAFGPFELNPAAGELRKSGIRIRLPEQPLQILLLLIARSGETVSRDELREQIWTDGTFVDFEHGVYAAMNRLRRALGDSAENARYIETIPGRGYRFIGALHSPDGRSPLRGSDRDAEAAVSRPPRRIWLWLGSAVGCAISAAAGWYMHAPAEAPVWTISRVTSDAGLSDAPAISRDGKLIAYSSEGPEGGRDIYLKQVTGGPPIRLTFDGADNTQPDFSPDGGRIAFRSSRSGGGIFEMPAFGGEIRAIAPEGQDPKFSPDGSRIAYWVGDPEVAEAVPGVGSVWTVAPAGGPPSRVGPRFTSARYPIWSADGRKLLVAGYTSENAYDSSALDWWVVPSDGGPPVPTGAYAVFSRAGLVGAIRDFDAGAQSESNRPPIPTVPRPYCWAATDDRVMFGARSARADTFSLWQMTVSPRTGKLGRAISRVTAGAANESEASCAAGDVVAFASPDRRTNLWLLPADLNRGITAGALTRLSEGPARREYPSLSNNGRQIAFASAQSGLMDIWTRDLETGSEAHLPSSPFVRRFPVISRSGQNVAFSSYENGARSVYVSLRGGAPEKICGGCLRATDWSPDEKTLLVFGGTPYDVSELDIASRRKVALLKDSRFPLLYARYSPDQRWVSFTARREPNRGRIAIAPADGRKPVPESAWITISEEGLEDWAFWSPDGNTLYFTSRRDGHACLWGQRLDAKSRRPAGAAFAVQHLHARARYEAGGWSAAGHAFTMALLEQSGNIWMMSRSDSR